MGWFSGCCGCLALSAELLTGRGGTARSLLFVGDREPLLGANRNGGFHLFRSHLFNALFYSPSYSYYFTVIEHFYSLIFTFYISVFYSPFQSFFLRIRDGLMLTRERLFWRSNSTIVRMENGDGESGMNLRELWSCM